MARRKAIGDSAATFMSVNGVAAGRAAILEGFALAHGSSAEATPTAIPAMLLRLNGATQGGAAGSAPTLRRGWVARANRAPAPGTSR
jgi:hypothetical protein